MNDEKKSFAQREEEVLEFWKKNRIFEKTLKKESPEGEFIFYDGPPFATGLPHYGHIIGGTLKDVVPRYKTMRGFHVPRRWGWDCHGLPIENLIEKELGLKTKKDILDYGIEKFNYAAAESVMRFASDWRKIVPRLGRFVDMANDYRTMDTSYTESVWWAFKTLYDKGLIYEGFKSMHICPRCETTLSNFEVTQGYKDVTDISVYAKFELVDEPGTHFLAWTTTPWTLPGNAALAVHPDADYVKISVGNTCYFLAKHRLGVVKDPYEIVMECKGKQLVGKTYRPLFDYYVNDISLKNKENAWRVYPAEFVTTEDGTGFVHIAPAFGEDDYQLSIANDLPFIQHVDMAGHFKQTVRDFAGKPVKPKDDPQAADIEIIKHLAHAGLLFAKEKIVHPYPHCWRCDTPLLNYAASSWFVKVTKIKSDLVAENKKIGWVPDDVKEGRFGKWLEGAKDWAISRSRFWGAPIPAWKCASCKEVHVMGSVEELVGKHTGSATRVILLRHGESKKNTDDVFDTSPDGYPLTEKGRSQALEAAEALKDMKIDAVYASPVLRARETAKIVADVLGKEIVIADGLREVHSGEWEGKKVHDPSIQEARMAYNGLPIELYYEGKRGKTGESWKDVEERMATALSEIVSKNAGKTVLLVSHQGPLAYLMRRLKKLTLEDTGKQYNNGFVENYARPQVIYIDPKTGQGLDLHRPSVDGFVFDCACGGVMRRVEEVFDCWFESGSMPFASNHYPFENAHLFDPKHGLIKRSRGYPADFIAEGLDQTRGWFYSMLVLSVALFGHSAYRQVIVNGIVLAEDGQKMSKRLKNYPDPMDVVAKYGADALRYYLLSSPVVRAQDLCFSEKGVDEVTKKILLRLDNVLSFYKMYAVGAETSGEVSEHVLDRWINARLLETVAVMTRALEKYEIDRAARPIGDFIEDLSVWYLRRSRERLKGDTEDKKAALRTLRGVLLDLSKLIAPFMPFYAEYLYGRVGGSKESVHLETWPAADDAFGGKDRAIIDDMKEARAIVSVALEQRAKANSKVRQPLGSLSLRSLRLSPEFTELIADEVNVKEVKEDKNQDAEILLDTTVTPELREEGKTRELIRFVQDLRKQLKLQPSDLVTLLAETNDDGKVFLERNTKELRTVAGIVNITFDSADSEEISIDNLRFKLSLKRQV